ncbi:NAD-glutamate dehydrogenase [Marinimicrobium sp. ABcell2]|uniref:NAD-glutamate dehydrogenase n=1 Tax=Marinimicrobium sp. ABcell2 TaxID=3069751 RepID=UPI0027B38666|nr:NAD-glutamate dehydrogenase [Marinimicrobium sp. ABcell2]MDQ2075623.1 NAD-glutamate dehydrogenase [Marinimicrobium sp. ABcell2]
MERLIADVDTPALLKKLHSLASESLGDEELASWEEFARQFFDRFLLSEWAGREVKDIYGAVHSCWRMLKHYNPSAPDIRLFNPTLEEDGWLCPHTVLQVQQKDMPFLVDSIRVELNRRNIAIHSIKSTLLQVSRDSEQKLERLYPPPVANGNVVHEGKRPVIPGANREALIYMEISLHTEPKFLRSVIRELREVLREVEAVVSDYQPLLDVTEEAEENLQRVSQVPLNQRVDESRAFLTWLRDDHFTFLAYAEYDLVSKKGIQELHENKSKRLGLFRLEDTPPDIKTLDDDKPGISQFYLSPKLIAFSKSATRARVHRHAYSDYVVVKRFNEQGEVCGEARILGLYTSNVYTVSPQLIPLIREKVEQVFLRTGLDRTSHDGKALRQILETFPRDELFQSRTSELYEIVTGVASINERYMVRLFMRPDTFGKFVNCLVYVPRDLFNTRVRIRIQELIGRSIQAEELDFTTHFSESILARVHMVFRIDPNLKLNYDVRRLEREIVEITRSWEDRLLTALVEAKGEERATQLLEQYGEAFPAAYREHFDARTAVQDIDFITALGDTHDLGMSFYQPVDVDARSLRFKVFRRGEPMELSDVIPVLENLGVRVVSEHPYHIVTRDHNSVWLHKFNLFYDLPVRVDVQAVKHSFQDAFEAVWHGHAESDAFNRLVLGARLSWREVMLLRALACYMRQTLFNFTDSYIASALVNHMAITRNLVALFKAKFDPRLNRSSRNQGRVARLQEKIIAGLDAVPNLNEDRILRRYLAVLEGTLRTNYFQTNSLGSHKDYLSIKLSPRSIPDIPEPRPLYEIFVYSPRIEGVHLRGGKVARGGLRWSDRLQDYRTEVLGLVKAQQVKNAVIVPNGAKGGFVCKRPPAEGSRAALQKEAIACYQIFIRGLLDITDNLKGDAVVPPKDVIRLDDDDPYLVVAADKGTASFSDIANEISLEYQHWLGDAFASGGSQGYDHKAMGITARGAWVAVQRHFREVGVDVQKEDFTVVGVGDMGGDVFGNGMLQSKHIQLVAAFNHLHIFVDPNPDASSSFEERKRLFSAERSGWSEYSTRLISSGGGIFTRDAKSIRITPEMKERFDISAEELAPNDLIRAILKAPVDLLWNGGIGTYVKSRSESHGDVGDKSNDSLRVNGEELRCKVVGEGGNLGMTQAGRVEYSLNGGACNTDFVDNAGGVDCSDHEVNAKILLNTVMADGDLTEKQRNRLLESMTDNVARLVLSNNYHQTQAISLAQTDALKRNAEYRRVMNTWHSQGRLDRELEFLPDDETLDERYAQGQGLTRPELAILISYAKVILKNDLAEADIASDDYVARFAYNAFPEKLRQRYPEQIDTHHLRCELVATQVANDLVNHMGISFAQRLIDSTGVGAGDVAKAYIIARDTHRLSECWKSLEDLDYRVDANIQMALMTTMMRRVRRASRWFLRNRRSHLDPAEEVAKFAPAVHELIRNLPDLLRGEALQEWQASCQGFSEAGVPEALVSEIASPGYLYGGLSVVEVAQQLDIELLVAAQMYFDLAELLQLHGVAGQISDVNVESYWHAMARETYLDDLESQLRSLTKALCRFVTPEFHVDAVIEHWSRQQSSQLERWRNMANEVQNSAGNDFAIFSVALRELLDLVQIAQHTETLDGELVEFSARASA